MQVQVQRPTETQVDVNVRLEPQEVDEVFKRVLRKIRGKASLAGFRPGKAPAALVLRHFREIIEAEAAEELAKKHVGDAIEQAEVNPVTTPRLRDLPEGAKSGEAFEFVLECDVLPELNPVGYKDLDLPDEPIEVEDDKIERELVAAQKAQAEAVPAEGRPVELGDKVELRFWGKVGDHEIDEEQPITEEKTLGQGDLIPGFEEGVVGAEVSVPKSFTFDFPEDYPDDALAGKPAEITVVVDALYGIEYPPIDDDLARGAGYDDLPALRKAITDKLQTAAEKALREKRLDAMYEQLLEHNQFSLPDALVQEKAQATQQYIAQMMAMQGMQEEQLKELMESSSESTLRSSQRGLKISHLISAIAKKENIEVGDEDREIAMRLESRHHGMPLPRVRARYADEKAKAEFDANLVYEKTLRFLLGEPEPELPPELEEEEAAAPPLAEDLVPLPEPSKAEEAEAEAEGETGAEVEAETDAVAEAEAEAVAEVEAEAKDGEEEESVHVHVHEDEDVDADVDADEEEVEK